MQEVVRYFQSPPFDWATRDDPLLRNTQWMFLVLKCGHVKRDPWETYQNETAVRIRAVLHHTFTPEEIRRVRCHQCVNGKAQSGIPKVIPEPTKKGDLK